MFELNLTVTNNGAYEFNIAFIIGFNEYLFILFIYHYRRSLLSGIAPFTSSDPSSDHTSLTTTDTTSDSTSAASFYYHQNVI